MKQLMGIGVVLGLGFSLAACGSSDNSGGSGSSSGGSSGGGSMEPTISISSPTAGVSVAVTKPNDNVSITFAVTNFTLKMPGSCGAEAGTDNCGHVHILVDEAACTPSGSPYNNDAASSPGIAILSSCPMANGTHTATLELHHDDHSPILVGGKVVSASVMFTATGG